MKKLTFLFFFFVATVAQAQTKEETIEWINTYAANLLKCEKHFGYPVVSVTIFCADDGTLTISYEKDINSTSWTQKNYTYKVNLKNVILDEAVNNVNDYGGVDTKPKSVLVNNNFGEQSLTESFHLMYSDKAGAIRVKKAIMHLAKLFGATSAVSKDTF